MAQRVSRRKLADYVAERITAGASVTDSLREIAAYLIATKRTREQELVVRDIEAALADRGLVIASVTSVHQVSESLHQQIKDLTGAESLQLRSTIDETVLGGVRIDIPGKRFDGTIRRKLNALKAQQL
ncbi:MAG: F0F1 ATP synthase subunit delta [Candidatus Saccharimonadales bacterium]